MCTLLLQFSRTACQHICFAARTTHRWRAQHLHIRHTRSAHPTPASAAQAVRLPNPCKPGTSSAPTQPLQTTSAQSGVRTPPKQRYGAAGFDSCWVGVRASRCALNRAASCMPTWVIESKGTLNGHTAWFCHTASASKALELRPMQGARCPSGLRRAGSWELGAQGAFVLVTVGTT